MDILEASRTMDLQAPLFISLDAPKPLTGQQRRNPDVVRALLDRLAPPSYIYTGLLLQEKGDIHCSQEFTVSTKKLHCEEPVDNVVTKMNDVRKYLSRSLAARAKVNDFAVSNPVFIATITSDMFVHLLRVYGKRIEDLLSPEGSPSDLQKVADQEIEFIDALLDQLEVIDWEQPCGWRQALGQYFRYFRPHPQLDILTKAERGEGALENFKVPSSTARSHL